MPIDPMTGQMVSVEDAAKMALSQRAQATLHQAAADDAAFQQQLAATRYARASARLPRTIQLPTSGAIGSDEMGAAIRAGDAKQPGGEVIDPHGAYTNQSVARHMARTETALPSYFKDKSMVTDLPEILQLTLEERRRLEQEGRSANTAQRGLDAARGKTAPGVWKYGEQPGDAVPERDVGLIRGTIEKPLGRATPDSGAQQMGPSIASHEAGGDVPLAEVLRHLQARLPKPELY